MPDLNEAASEIFHHWLNARTGLNYRPAGLSPDITLTDGRKQIQLAVRPVFDVDDHWTGRLRLAGEELDKQCDIPVAVWIPPETRLPHEPEFFQRIAQVASNVETGHRGQVEFPVKLTLKKTSTEASYVQVVGGLAPHWARLTGRAYGQYLLDTSPIHRLPEPESRVADLLEWIALLGNGMKAGTSSEINAEDAWTINALAHGQGSLFIGAPPGMDPTNGTRVRVLLRNALRDAGTESRAPGTMRALLLVGIYRNLNEETATIALRSCDPELYNEFDHIVLIADGLCKSLFERTDGA
jgi:hypothetical protein